MILRWWFDTTVAARQQQRMEEDKLGDPADELRKKEIYTYPAPWLIYGMAWSVRPDQKFRLAVGSFLEDYTNKGVNDTQFYLSILTVIFSRF